MFPTFDRIIESNEAHLSDNSWVRLITKHPDTTPGPWLDAWTICRQSKQRHGEDSTSAQAQARHRLAKLPYVNVPRALVRARPQRATTVQPTNPWLHDELYALQGAPQAA